MPAEWRVRSEVQRRNTWIAVWPVVGTALILFIIGWRAAQGELLIFGNTVSASSVSAPHGDAQAAALDQSRTEAAALRGEVATLNQQVHQDTIDIITSTDRIELMQSELASANTRREEEHRQMTDLRDQFKRLCTAASRISSFPDASAIAACRTPAK
jgi:cell division protein FtsB